MKICAKYKYRQMSRSANNCLIANIDTFALPLRLTFMLLNCAITQTLCTLLNLRVFCQRQIVNIHLAGICTFYFVIPTRTAFIVKGVFTQIQLTL